MKKFILSFILSALTLSAWAATGWWKWNCGDSILKDAYTGKSSTKAMPNHTVYVLNGRTSRYADANMLDQKALLADLRTDEKTMFDVIAMAVDNRKTDSTGHIYSNHAFSMEPATSTGFYTVAFESYNGYDYVMLGIITYSYKGTTEASPQEIVPPMRNTYYGTGTPKNHDNGGWCRIGPTRYVVYPATADNVSSEVYTNGVLVTKKNVLVFPNASAKIVYTADDGYLFGNGAKAITNEVVASSNPTVDTMDYGAFVTNNVVVTNSQGQVLGEIALSKAWVEQVEEENPGVALGDTQDNGITLLENKILGLDGSTPGNIPVIAPVQSADADTVTFALDNVAIDDMSCAKVTYRVVPSEGEPSKSVGPGETVPMALPDTGVRYYKIEVDVGATK